MLAGCSYMYYSSEAGTAAIINTVHQEAETTYLAFLTLEFVPVSSTSTADGFCFILFSIRSRPKEHGLQNFPTTR